MIRFERIEEKDVLNTGRKKLNNAIAGSEQAVNDSADAKQKSEQALSNSESTQSQLDTIVIEGDSSVEAAQARVDEKGDSHSTLKDRIDDGFTKTNAQLADTGKFMRQSLSQGQGDSDGVYVLFVLDDGKIEDYTKIKPIAESKNVPFNIGVITNRVGDSEYMSWEQLHELEDGGLFEIMSHTADHHTRLGNSETSLEEIIDDVKTAHDELIKNGFNPRGFVYPFNSWSDKSIGIVQKYHDFAFAKTRGDGNFFNHPDVDNQMIRRTALGSYFDGDGANSGLETDTLEYYKYMFDQAKEQESLLVYVLHPSETEERQFGYLEDLIDYIKSNDGKIVKATEGLKIKGNILQTRNVSIDNNGEFLNGNIVKNIKNYYSAFDSIDKYPKNSIVTSYFNKDGNEGMPVNAGTLITYNAGDQRRYASQVVKEYNHNNTFERQWKSDGWEEWIKRNTLIIYKENNSFNSSDGLSKFESGSITIFVVDSDNSEGFPSKGGIVTTYKVGGNDRYASQEFREYNGIRIWQRIAGSSDNWSGWTLINSVRVATGTNAYDSGSLVTDFPEDSITYFAVNRSGAAGFPEDNPGFATVYRVGNQHAFARQEFRSYDDNDLWSRSGKNDGTWNDWRKLSV